MRKIEDLIYTEDSGPPLALDLYLPDRVESALPVVLCITGGGWYLCDRSLIDPFLADEGFAVASPTYRTSEEALAPANVYDCRAALRWLRAHASEFGLDPKRVGIWGQSAGGHLGALLALTPGLKELEGDRGNPGQSTDVQALCVFYAPMDLTRLAEPTLMKAFPVLYDAVERYLGGPPGEHLELARLVSPMQYRMEHGPPTLIVHGESDSTVSFEESVRLHEALQQAGVDSLLRIFKGQEHGFNPPDLANDEVRQFFVRTLSSVSSEPVEVSR